MKAKGLVKSIKRLISETHYVTPTRNLDPRIRPQTPEEYCNGDI